MAQVDNKFKWGRQTHYGLPEEVYKGALKLCRPNRLFDIFTVIGVTAIFLVLLFSYKFFYTNVWLIILYILVQGFALHTMAQLAHEYVVHGRFMVRTISIAVPLLVPFSPTYYRKIHLKHHDVFPNCPEDPDKNVNNLKTSWEKILSFTVIGYLLIFKRNDAVQAVSFTPGEKVQIRLESMLFIALLLVAAVLSYYHIHILLFGWFIPAVIGVAFFSGLRTFSEHSTTSPNSFLGTGLPLRTPRLLMCTPYCTLYGEGHIIHHLFPTIPWYRYFSASRLLRPYIEKEIGRVRFFPAFYKWVCNKE